MNKTDILPEEIMNKIYFIRGQKVMLDRDLAILYGVETKRLKEAVRRNLLRFPEDFMFEMTVNEFEEWRGDYELTKEDKMGLRYSPFCFTEQGVTMLSCILNSETAINVNIQIIRIFARMRELISTNKDILLKLEKMEIKMLKSQEMMNQHDEEIALIFKYMKKLLNAENPPREPIGFKTKGNKESK
jgi:ORF6N domain